MPPPLNAADLTVMFGLPPAEAVRFVESKGYKITWNWWEARDEAHAKALTVAKVGRVDILQDIQSALVRNLSRGETERDFIQKLAPVLRAKGWWGRRIVVDPEGNAQSVQLGSPARLSTIYRSNAQSAYMAGRYKAMSEAIDSHPWWQYVAVLDSRTRPRHRALNGKVFHSRDAIWRHIWPPNGHGCRCSTRPLSQTDLEREGLAPMSSTGRIVHIDDATPADPRTGEFERVRRIGIRVPGPDGKDVVFAPDLGFGGNPGLDWTRPFTPPPRDSLPRTFLPGQALPELPPAARFDLSRRYPSGLAEEEYFERFRNEFPEDARRTGAFIDVTGVPVPVSEQLFQDKAGEWKILKEARYMDLPMLAEGIQHPDEIWLAWHPTKNGGYALRRRYLKVFDTGEADAPGVAVFEEGRDGWLGVTAFRVDDTFVRRHGFAGASEYLQAQRGGFLIYRRGG